MHLLFCQNKVFTFWTIPSIFLSQNLWLFKQLKAILNSSSCLFLGVFLILIAHIWVFEIVENFFNFFIFFSPIKFHLNFLFFIGYVIMKVFFWIIRKGTALTTFYTTILTFSKSWGWNSKESKRLFLFRNIDNFFLIVRNWINVFVKWIDFIMNVFKSCRRREIIKSIWSDIFSITLIAIIRMTNNIGQNDWDIGRWFFPFVLFSHINVSVLAFIFDKRNCIIHTQRFTCWIRSYVCN